MNELQLHILERLVVLAKKTNCEPFFAETGNETEWGLLLISNGIEPTGSVCAVRRTEGILKCSNSFKAKELAVGINLADIDAIEWLAEPVVPVGPMKHAAELFRLIFTTVKPA